MQRIDENTYIDGTLVTCAEYQLFIDEMREKGQFHQPDHWASHQFPKGQAHKPILGMRYSDAVAFCEWLTWQELSGWGYRLLTQAEAKEYPLEPKNRPLGFWIFDGNDQSHFFWISSVSPNIRNLDIGFSINRYFQAYGLNQAGTRYSDRTKIRDRILVDVLDRHSQPATLDLDRVFAIGLDFDLYNDLSTLRERIAGRSPAFEGIRIVKERIR